MIKPDYDEILAKSDPSISLKQHIEDGLTIWKFLQQAFPKLPVIEKQKFWELLHLCIIFHDLGKAHSEFQHMLRNEKNKWFGQRHELFSIPFVDGLTINEADKQFIRQVVAGHHKDYDKLMGFIEHTYKQEKKNSFMFELDEENELSFEKEFTGCVNADFVTELLKEYSIELSNPYPQLPRKIILDYKRNRITLNNKDFLKLLLLTGGFKQCDHLSSAFIQKIEIIKNEDFEFLRKQQLHLQEKGLDFYVHQKDSMNKEGNVILTAPTGSGKTEAAFLWLQKQIQTSGQGRVFYVLPFTASINAMYERLRKDINPEKIGLVHGKLSEYLYDLVERENPESSKCNKQQLIYKIRENYKTLVTPIKITTPFQLLKNIFGLKGFEKGIFEWAGGYFIFDEIHAYRPDIFAQLIVLIEFAVKHLQVNVFIMTATLPKFMKNELLQVISPYSEIVAQDELYHQFTRHKVILKDLRITW